MRLLLEKYVKVAVKKALKEQEVAVQKQQKSVYLIYKFPGLKQAMVSLMSPAFPKFISDIRIVSPKPTTFNVSLVNGMDFYLTYSAKGQYIAKVQGKKYNLINFDEAQRACQSISNMLELRFSPAEEANVKKSSAPSTPQGSGEGGTFPGEAPPATGGSEIPPDLAADLDNLNLPSEEEENTPVTPEL